MCAISNKWGYNKNLSFVTSHFASNANVFRKLDGNANIIICMSNVRKGMPVNGMVHQDEYLCIGRDIVGHMYAEVHIRVCH